MSLSFRDVVVTKSGQNGSRFLLQETRGHTHNSPTDVISRCVLSKHTASHFSVESVMLIRLAGPAALLTVLLLTTSLGAQGSIRYIYDELGRLVGVIDANGDSATYHFDAVGNAASPLSGGGSSAIPMSRMLLP